MFMQVEMSQLNLSARAYHRILKLARAIENLVDIKGKQTYAIFASHRDSDKKPFIEPAERNGEDRQFQGEKWHKVN